MKINVAVIAIVIIAVLGFVYFSLVKNNRDRKALEQEMHDEEVAENNHEAHEKKV